ncbi:MAG: hypothetical protein QOJ29_2118, partial [Thermoleophilaceae bacterium]|nr:hypothetical protein [Thermoleophilaceae bacterium]
VLRDRRSWVGARHAPHAAGSRINPVANLAHLGIGGFLLFMTTRMPAPVAGALAARQLVERALAQRGRVGRRERTRDALTIVRRLGTPETLVRVASTCHEVADGQSLGRDRGLRQKPTRRATSRVGSFAIALPSSRTLPACGSISRAIARNSVDLPLAFAPTIAVMRPSASSQSRSRSTSCAP